MDNEQQIPTRKVIPPTSLVAIICLAVGLVIGYLYDDGKQYKYRLHGDGKTYRIDTETGETWFALSSYGNPRSMGWIRVSE